MYAVKSFNASGKIMNEMHFFDKNKAYAEYKEWLRIAETLPKGYETTIVRYDEFGYVMSLQTVVGKA